MNKFGEGKVGVKTGSRQVLKLHCDSQAHVVRHFESSVIRKEPL